MPIMQKKKRNEKLKTLKSQYWYWKSRDMFGDGREEDKEEQFK